MRRLTGLALVAVVLLSAGCTFLRSGKYRSYPENPFGDVRTVAIFPFLNETTQAVDGMEFAQIFSNELVKFPGFKVIRPNAVADRAVRDHVALNSVGDIIKFGRSLQADAVIVASITDYDPYRPPRIALSVQMFSMKKFQLSAQDIAEMVQSARWAQRPMAIQSEDASHVIAAFEKVYDSHNDSVRNEVLAYAEAQEGEDYAYVNGHQFMAISNRYMQFVSSQVLFEVMNKTDVKP